MERPDIAALAAVLAESGLDELHLTGPGTDIHLTRPGAPVLREGTILSPGIGVFLTAHPLHAAPLAPPGQRVRAGQTVGLLRVGPVLRPVAMPADGIAGPPLAAPGTLVGYGAALFAFHPDPPETPP